MNKNRYIRKYQCVATPTPHKTKIRNRPYLQYYDSGKLEIKGFGGNPVAIVRTKADIAEAITVFRRENHIIKEGSINCYLQKMKSLWPRKQEVAK